MYDGLAEARHSANMARFKLEGVNSGELHLDRHERALSNNRRLGLEVIPDLMPGIYQVIEGVTKRLHIDISLTRSFVHADQEMQARCSMARGQCIIELSSGLVQSLSANELAFVIGHEIGHFLLDHHYLPLSPTESYERWSVLRAREISADRLGLIACGSIDNALRAIIKTFSGLADEHLRFDTVAFLGRHFDDTIPKHIEASPYDTHPSFPLRARCLIKFSIILEAWKTPKWDQKFTSIDDAVSIDFKKFGEARVTELIGEAIIEHKKWTWMFAAVYNGFLDESAQQIISSEFGPDFLFRFKKNFENLPRYEVMDFVSTRMKNAHDKFKLVAPSLFNAISREQLEICAEIFRINLNSHPLGEHLQELSAE